MKTINSFYTLMALTSAFLATARLSWADQSGIIAEEPGLQVRVDIPPTWRPQLDDEVAEALARRLDDTFVRNGFKRPIKYVPFDEKPHERVPVLELRLIEWRIDIVGNAQCSFIAYLKIGEAESRLGLFNASSLFALSSGGRWGITARRSQATALEDAAEKAIDELYDRVAGTDRVPGLQRLKRTF